MEKFVFPFISSISLIISIYSLWKTHLSPFKLATTFNSPIFKCYKITKKHSGENKIWFIPSIDLIFNFINLGSKPGRILNIAFKVKKDNKVLYSFKPKWVIKTNEFLKNKDRFSWLKNAVDQDWFPFFVLPHQSINKHLIFEPEDGTPWTATFPKGIFETILEIQTDEVIGEKILGKFKLILDAEWIEKELKQGSSFTLLTIENFNKIII